VTSVDSAIWKGNLSLKIEEIQTRLDELLGLLRPETMQQVYEYWIERLRQVIHTDGDCVSGQVSS
jgi:hypothetical protein